MKDIRDLEEKTKKELDEVRIGFFFVFFLTCCFFTATCQRQPQRNQTDRLTLFMYGGAWYVCVFMKLNQFH